MKGAYDYKRHAKCHMSTLKVLGRSSSTPCEDKGFSFSWYQRSASSQERTWQVLLDEHCQALKPKRLSRPKQSKRWTHRSSRALSSHRLVPSHIHPQQLIYVCQMLDVLGYALPTQIQCLGQAESIDFSKVSGDVPQDFWPPLQAAPSQLSKTVVNIPGCWFVSSEEIGLKIYMCTIYKCVPLDFSLQF